MTEMEESVLREAEILAERTFEGDSSGHDMDHTLRVARMAMRLAEEEGADPFRTRLAALLHDVDDRKLSPETADCLSKAAAFLKEHRIPDAESILAAIREVSFAGSDSVRPSSIEGCCVQDADRLDAMGAIGIARAFAYGGSRGRKMYDPEILPRLNMDGETYRQHVSTTLNHFYEKLFLLKDRMTTASGRRIAQERDRVLRGFVDEFLDEWKGIR